MGKQADQDIVKVLGFIEEYCEMYSNPEAEGTEDEPSFDQELRRVEVLIRRLAREAGYELPAT